MGKLATVGNAAAGGVGALILAAAATKPEDAISNLGGWARIIGADQLVPLLSHPGVDSWGKVVGSLLVAGALLWWLRRRWLSHVKTESSEITAAIELAGRAAPSSSDTATTSENRISDLEREFAELERQRDRLKQARANIEERWPKIAEFARFDFKEGNLWSAVGGPIERITGEYEFLLREAGGEPEAVRSVPAYQRVGDGDTEQEMPYERLRLCYRSAARMRLAALQQIEARFTAIDASLDAVRQRLRAHQG